jgi:hypothetical protein
MFRDRVVSMEQTFEGGEKHLPLLKQLCLEALPGFELREHSLDHERDLFVMDFEGPDGARKRVCWTRMVLFDAERLPTLASDPAAALRAKIVDLLVAQASRSEIVVTFRHLEEGWVDTPEPKRESRRRRRGGRGGRGGDRGGERGGRPGGAGGRDRDRRPGGPQAGGPAPSPQPARGPAPSRPGSPERRPPGGPERRPSVAAAGPEPGAAGAGAGKRRRRRRRRGRGPGGGSGAPGASPAPGPKA